MISQVLVSVIIPTFKRPDTLDRAIKSVLAQTYPNVEVIVVDDNDPDTEGRALTEAKMALFADEPRVRYIKHECNKNGSAARNTGARVALGEYIAFLDDDDEFLPCKIESQIKRFNELDDTYGCCYSKYAVRMPDGRQAVGKENREGNLFVEALCRELCTMAGSNLLVKKESFDSIGGFDESFKRHQDVEFLTRLLQKYKMAYDKQLGLIVNVHSQDSKADYQKILDQYESCFSKYLETMDNSVRVRFYSQINIQRFWDYLRTKKDFKSCIKMIKEKKISIVDACSYTLAKTFKYTKRRF